MGRSRCGGRTSDWWVSSQDRIITHTHTHPKDVHVLTPRFCENVASHGVRDFTHVIQVKAQGRRWPCPGGSSLITRVFKSGDPFPAASEGAMRREGRFAGAVACFEDGGSARAKHAGSLQEREKARQQNARWRPRRERSPADTGLHRGEPGMRLRACTPVRRSCVCAVSCSVWNDWSQQQQSTNTVTGRRFRCFEDSQCRYL